MITETITYIDFDGNERTEDFQFNFTEAELMNIQFSEIGGVDKLIIKIIQTKDEVGLIKLFQMFIDKAYGVKSPDGRKFVKSKEALDDFKYTEAYSKFYMKLIMDQDYASKFINGCIPSNLREKYSVEDAKDLINSKVNGEIK